MRRGYRDNNYTGLACLGLIALCFGAWLFGAFMLMIIVGVAHHDWWPLIPTMSYKTALLISTLSMIYGAFSGGAKGVAGRADR